MVDKYARADDTGSADELKPSVGVSNSGRLMFGRGIFKMTGMMRRALPLLLGLGFVLMTVPAPVMAEKPPVVVDKKKFLELRQPWRDAVAAHKAGRYGQAIAGFTELTRSLPEYAGFWLGLADAYRKNRQVDRAEKAAQEALRRAKMAKHAEFTAFANEMLAKIAMRRKIWPVAERHLIAALEQFRALDKMKKVADIYGMQGGVAVQQRNYDQALTLHQRALTLRRQLKDGRQIAGELSRIGWLLTRMKWYRAAEKPLDEALDLYLALNKARKVAEVRALLGKVHAGTREFNRAIVLLDAAIDFFGKGRHRRDMAQLADATGTLGTVYQRMKEHDRALGLLRRAAEIENRLGIRGSIGFRYANIGNVLRDKGDRPGACRNWQRAEEAFTRIGATPLIRRVQESQRLNNCNTMSKT